MTEPLVDLARREWALVARRLEETNLLTVRTDESLDTHPLLREYFGQRLRATQPEAWQAAHRRLYEHLCTTTKEGNKPTLEDLQPLYQAVAHGCQAGLQQEACDKVYRDRIQRGEEYYGTTKLGAFASDLAAIASFFETPWSRVSPALSDPARGWLLNQAAVRLLALAQATEALGPMRAGLEMAVEQEHWQAAAIRASNLSDLELTLGEVTGALQHAEMSVTYADRSDDDFQEVVARVAHADALHQSGLKPMAEVLFCEAEEMQAKSQPGYPLLYGIAGFEFCDLLLSEVERVAGREGELSDEELLAKCRAVLDRATRTLKWAAVNNIALLDIAVGHLTLGCAALYAAILESRSRRPKSAQTLSPPTTPDASLRLAANELDLAVSGLHTAGQQNHLPRGLLTRAWLRSLTGPHTGAESAQSDLNEAWEIAERGPMPLFLADIQLYRSRLFFREKTYPWQSPQHDLAEARRLIFRHGYLRRREELEDAEAALRHFGSAPTQ